MSHGAAETNDTFQEVRHEHERLNELLATVRQVFKEIHSAADRLPDYVAELQAELNDHFALEEAGGYFAEVCEARPRLVGEIKRLREQHEQFQDQLKEMSRLAAESSNPTTGWRAVERSFNDMARELLKHEAAENQLIQEAYSRDLGSND